MPKATLNPTTPRPALPPGVIDLAAVRAARAPTAAAAVPQESDGEFLPMLREIRSMWRAIPPAPKAAAEDFLPQLHAIEAMLAQLPANRGRRQ